jgi:hypothetical protein
LIELAAQRRVGRQAGRRVKAVEQQGQARAHGAQQRSQSGGGESPARRVVAVRQQQRE